MYGKNKRSKIEEERDPEVQGKIEEAIENLRESATSEDWKALEGAIGRESAADLQGSTKGGSAAAESAVTKTFDLEDSALVNLITNVSEPFRDGLALIHDLIMLDE